MRCAQLPSPPPPLLPPLPSFSSLAERSLPRDCLVDEQARIPFILTLHMTPVQPGVDPPAATAMSSAEGHPPNPGMSALLFCASRTELPTPTAPVAGLSEVPLPTVSSAHPAKQLPQSATHSALAQCSDGAPLASPSPGADARAPSVSGVAALASSVTLTEQLMPSPSRAPNGISHPDRSRERDHLAAAAVLAEAMACGGATAEARLADVLVANGHVADPLAADMCAASVAASFAKPASAAEAAVCVPGATLLTNGVVPGGSTVPNRPGSAVIEVVEKDTSTAEVAACGEMSIRAGGQGTGQPACNLATSRIATSTTLNDSAGFDGAIGSRQIKREDLGGRQGTNPKGSGAQGSSTTGSTASNSNGDGDSNHEISSNNDTGSNNDSGSNNDAVSNNDSGSNNDAGSNQDSGSNHDANSNPADNDSEGNQSVAADADTASNHSYMSKIDEHEHALHDDDGVGVGDGCSGTSSGGGGGGSGDGSFSGGSSAGDGSVFRGGASSADGSDGGGSDGDGIDATHSGRKRQRQDDRQGTCDGNGSSAQAARSSGSSSPETANGHTDRDCSSATFSALSGAQPAGGAKSPKSPKSRSRGQKQQLERGRELSADSCSGTLSWRSSSDSSRGGARHANNAHATAREDEAGTSHFDGCIALMVAASEAEARADAANTRGMHDSASALQRYPGTADGWSLAAMGGPAAMGRQTSTGTGKRESLAQAMAELGQLEEAVASIEQMQSRRQANDAIWLEDVMKRAQARLIQTARRSSETATSSLS